VSDGQTENGRSDGIFVRTLVKNSREASLLSFSWSSGIEPSSCGQRFKTGLFKAAERQ